MCRASYILLSFIATVIICCKGDDLCSNKVELVKYPKPFYHMKPGCSISFYYGIKDQRFFYVENISGSWLLYDNHFACSKPINVAGLDEYTFIELDMARLLHEKLQQNTNDFLPATPNFYDLYVRTN